MSSDAAFAGSIPGLYDQHLGPLLFEPYAREVARRVRDLKPERILETAAGTGIVTEALREAAPNAEIVATDLNEAMIEVAERRVRSGKVTFKAADAQDLPFDDDSFDLVVCQFGVMFYPDRVRGNSEARRVLRPGGRYIALIWNDLAANPAARKVHDAVAAVYPDDPPGFLGRTPYGYADVEAIRRDLRDAGFDRIDLDTVDFRSEPRATPHDAAAGFVLGCPLRAEIEERDSNGTDRALQAAEKATAELQQGGEFDSRLSAHIVTATK